MQSYYYITGCGMYCNMQLPLHYKLEKWATHKLVEKNKAIRLAVAKKTIRLLAYEELGDNELK